MKDLVSKLNKATKAYNNGHPIMSDKEWDDLYFKLIQMEYESGIQLPDSPTRIVSPLIVSALEKVPHNHLMLSLEKTKDINEIIFKMCMSNNHPFLAMPKMDGLTCSLRYVNGRLVSAETRGDGESGENIFHNALVIPSIPKYIVYKDELIVDGEIICSYEDFEKFNQEYSNPRNFAAGSIRLLDSNECAKRHLRFIAWDVIKGMEIQGLLSRRLDLLKTIGDFIVVPFRRCTSSFSEDHTKVIEELKEIAKNKSYPIDGMVFKYDEIDYGKSLGHTSHHFNNAIAYKFYDELFDTTLRNINWNMGRTGLLTPVAEFDKVDIDGAIVSNATLHNLNIINYVLKQPYKGQPIKIFKSNMIIPQVYSGEDAPPDLPPEDLLIPPKVCPVCGGPITIRNQMCFCDSPTCPGKFINKMTYFCGKKGMDIKGLSIATLTRLVDNGLITCYADVFRLINKKKEWLSIPGCGSKSVTKISEEIEACRRYTPLETFIGAIGIPFIGKVNARDIVKYVDSYADFRRKVKNKFNFMLIPNISEVKAQSILDFDYSEADEAAKYLVLSKENAPRSASNIPLTLEDKTIVITGRLNLVTNRNDLVSLIQAHGGKVTSSVSNKTSYLINNDLSSFSTKNIEAKRLGIPIMSEKEFFEKFLYI